MPTGCFGPEGFSLPKAKYANAAATPSSAKATNGGRQPYCPTRNGPISDRNVLPETPPITNTPIAVALRSGGNQDAISVTPGVNSSARNTPDTSWFATAAGYEWMVPKLSESSVDPRMPMKN